MQTLRIYLLGNLELHLGSKRLSGFATKKSKALFAFLVLGKGRLYSREMLADTFWGDLPEARARRALSTDLWRIGNLLKDGGADPDLFLISNSDTVGFNMDAPHWVDVERFEAATRQIAHIDPSRADHQLVEEVSETAALYRGDLLDGIYDDWCQMQREALHAQHLHVLEFLMQHNAAHEYWSKALAIGQKILSIDPLIENVQRSVMRCHFKLGNRPAAVKQYATCARLLRQELDVEPMEETRQALEAIISAPTAKQFSEGLVPLDSEFGSVEMRLQEITLAIASIDAARSCLINAERQLREQTDADAQPGPASRVGRTRQVADARV